MKRRALVLCLITTSLLGGVGSRALAADSARTYSAGSFVLDLGGSIDCSLHSVAGGGLETPILKEGQKLPSGKSIAGIRWSDLSLDLGPAMSPKVGELISALLQGHPKYTDGAVLVLDQTGKVTQRRAFAQALMSEVRFPALDASAKDAAFLGISLRPQEMKEQKGDGSTPPTVGAKDQRLAPNLFRVSIDGLPSQLKISRVESLVVHQQIAVDQIGDSRPSAAPAATLLLPDLTLTVAASSVPAFQKWQQQVTVSGRAATSFHDGKVEYQGADGKTIYALAFKRLLPKSIVVSGTGNTASAKVVLAVESIAISYPH